MTRAREKLTAACLCFAVALPAFAQGDARMWLDRMENAVEYLNYKGVFVHIHGGRSESMQIVHRAEGEVITERLHSLDGPKREIIRVDNTVKCILPDKQSLLVERLQGKTALQARLPTYTTQLDETYSFRLKRERGKVAGRRTRIIYIEPKDRYRYGYRLGLDEETAMPLKAQVMSADNEIIEQIWFVSITLHDSIPDAEFEAVTDHGDFVWYQQDPKSRALEKDHTTLWRAARLPIGFVLTESKTRMMAGSDEPVEHLVYSDGLAVVSVFVEMRSGGVDDMGGWSRMGAANVFATRRDLHLVTAVGEVPATTVEYIAESVQPTTLGAMR